MRYWYKSWYFLAPLIMILLCVCLATIFVVIHENDRNKQEEISTQSSLL